MVISLLTFLIGPQLVSMPSVLLASGALVSGESVEGRCDIYRRVGRGNMLRYGEGGGEGEAEGETSRGAMVNVGG